MVPTAWDDVKSYHSITPIKSLPSYMMPTFFPDSLFVAATFQPEGFLNIGQDKALEYSQPIKGWPSIS